MDRPTPEQERQFYLQALTAASPVVAAMSLIDQKSLIQQWDIAVTDETINLYNKRGTIQYHALITMATMLMRDVIDFHSTQDKDKELQEHMKHSSFYEPQADPVERTH